MWSAPAVGRVGVVGVVEVDVLSGEMDISPEAKAEFQRRAQELAAGLPAYRPRETPAAYLAGHVSSTHRPGRPVGDPLDLLSDPS
jgi:hypothetical protein